VSLAGIPPQGRLLLSISHVHKRFGAQVAVDDVSFEVRAGETVGLLGPNGAGKTTTLSMMSGIVKPDTGSVSIRGELVDQQANRLKQCVGLVPQDLALYEELSAKANLELFGGLYGLTGKLLAERAANALALVALEARRDDRVKEFSGGMKRRLNIAAALLHDPELVLLDEPTVGVDPQSRGAIFENLEELKRRGKTLVYTTHYMEEAERLCDRIVIIDHGKVVADDTVRNLYRRLPASQAVVIELDHPPAPASLLAVLAARPGIRSAQHAAAGIRLELDDFGAALAGALATLAGDGLRVASIHTPHDSLEDVFIALTGHGLRDGASMDSP